MKSLRYMSFVRFREIVKDDTFAKQTCWNHYSTTTNGVFNSMLL